MTLKPALFQMSCHKSISKHVSELSRLSRNKTLIGDMFEPLTCSITCLQRPEIGPNRIILLAGPSTMLVHIESMTVKKSFCKSEFSRIGCASYLAQQLDSLKPWCLQTLLCEVESIMNNRPITTLSDDPNDLKPLTPSHLLLLKKTTISASRFIQQ